MPNRIIKDSIRTSKSVNAMSDFQFRMWTYLITYVDDYGRGNADPDIIKGFVFPKRQGVTAATIQKTLAELATIGSLILYEVDGDAYLCFPNWSQHQTVRNKVSKFPAPEDGKITLAYTCKQMHANVPVIQSNPIQSESDSESNPSMCTRARMAEDGFARFWSAYPKKVGKESAEKIFIKLCPDEELLREMLDAIEGQKQGRQWREEDGRFIPHPATWLKHRRWEDEQSAACGASGSFDTDAFFEAALKRNLDDL